jgi:cytoskeletal protein CcmA (bactofilin family)
MWRKKLQTNDPESLKREGDYTFLAKGVEMEGIAKLDEHAVIRGSISADEIICSGKIEANMTANKRIQLLNPAVLIGDITTPSFSMEDGAFFQGVCDMGLSRRVERLTKESQDSEKVDDLIEHCELVHTH